MSIDDIFHFLESLDGYGLHDVSLLIRDGMPPIIATLNANQLGKVSDLYLLHAFRARTFPDVVFGTMGWADSVAMLRACHERGEGVFDDDSQ